MAEILEELVANPETDADTAATFQAILSETPFLKTRSEFV